MATSTRPSDQPAARPTVLAWEPFKVMFSREHKQGEHVALVGPTGGGKSTVAIELAKLCGAKRATDRRPSRVVVLGSKRRDATLSRLMREEDWHEIKHWPPSYGQEHVIVWPRNIPKSKRPAVHRAVFLPLLDRIDDEGGQTVVIDECAYFERPLPYGPAMAPTMEGFWSESRSNSVTLVGGTQRPRNVTRLMWSEPSWIIILQPEDEDDEKRVAELAGSKVAGGKAQMIELMHQLGPYEFLCVRRQRGGGRGLYVSRVDLPKRGKIRR